MEKTISEIKETFQFFTNSTSCLTEEDSGFSPKEGMFTVAQQVAHVAITVDWFLEPLVTGNSFDMDFETHDKKCRAVTSLEDARKMLDKSATKFFEFVESKDKAYFDEPLPDGPLMGGEPRSAIFHGIIDHTAHHRGALTVYSRLLGKRPKMPYGDV